LAEPPFPPAYFVSPVDAVVAPPAPPAVPLLYLPQAHESDAELEAAPLKYVSRGLPAAVVPVVVVALAPI
jgi:hypothetical protein